ncbi:MAG: homing endonuclease associated repeat-containing protein, partial [Flavobacterium sp.]|uniref:homing endonuclease associated repeat-containing protein n=1 Tax=Flavobacterium sp. TaxID=239 RepID=UPI003BCAE948
ISMKQYENRFGTWTDAIEKFCLSNAEFISCSNKKGLNATKKLLLQELIRIKEEYKIDTLQQKDLKKYSSYSITTFHKHFGSWRKALHSAKLKAGREVPTELDLFDELQSVWEKLGRQPYTSDMNRLSKYSHNHYSRKFGSWTKAIYAFNKDRTNGDVKINNSVYQERKEDEKISENMILNKPEYKNVKLMITPRNPSGRLRFLVFNRDGFKCKCGRSPSSDSTIILHVDHIIPYSKGGETLIENLQTLCSECNLGKSNLEP